MSNIMCKHFDVDARAKCTLVHHEMHQNGVSELIAVRKFICKTYTYFEEQLSEVEIIINHLLSRTM